ncbi:hypothetical protein JG687_00010538 [Phytophthora cactorum]|uniref:Uncharacterized protein n=1 Tax=Phytophthora cactorum TaxID=29920 RepID=A0A8T1U865_9STRA|nr:hypothetical protein JG687_00010538 [Phytophthora cactorum]
MAYTFDLDPVSAERIEELESKLRDQQNEVTRMSRVESKLQEELTRLKAELEAAQVVSFIQLEATGANGLSWLCWEGTESDDFKVTGANSVVKVRRPGVYRVVAFVSCLSSNYRHTVDLLKKGISIQSAWCNNARGHYTTTPLGLTTRLLAGDVLSVKCHATTSGTSYLSIERLGN